MSPEVETAAGHLVHLLEPKTEQIHFGDIAQSLAGIARYNNHTMGVIPYSVAQHSVWCAVQASNMYGLDDTTVMNVLLHDAHEAYTGDIVSPLKHIPEIYAVLKPIELKLQAVILQALAVPAPDPVARRIIHKIDIMARAVEAWHLMPSRGSDWGHPDVPPRYLATFKPAVDTQRAMQQFWMCFEFLKYGLPLSELPL